MTTPGGLGVVGKRSSLHNSYGARTLLRKYVGLSSERLLVGDYLVWQHGWLPEGNSSDIDLLVGESGETSALSDSVYWVARESQEAALKAFGVKNVYTVGLPFAYALRMFGGNVGRKKSSLLVMPAFHGVYSEGRGDHPDQDFADRLADSRAHFPDIVVVFNCDDIRHGRGNYWEDRGFTVTQGACEEDSSSLEKMVKLMRSHEVMVTNGFGSHIAYAAASGCRVAIYDGSLEFSQNQYLASTLFRNRPELVAKELESLTESQRMLADLDLYCLPFEAKDVTEWGQRQIGYDRFWSPEDLRSLIRDLYSTHTGVIDRLGLRPVAKKLSSLRWLLELARIRSRTSERRRLLPFLRNLLTLLSTSNGGPPSDLRLTDSKTRLFFRPGSSDLWSIHRKFVETDWESLALGNPSRILHLGSYAGYGLAYLLARFPASDVVGVEADRQNVNVAATQLYGEPRARVLHAAVWSETIEVSLVEGTDGTWSNKVVAQTDGLTQVPGLRLSDILANVSWERADVILMTIEGSEYEVLDQCASQISQLCDVLIVEFTNELARDREKNELLDRITERNKHHVSRQGRYTVITFRSNP